MKNILLIQSSPRGSDSYSHQAARSIVNEIQARNPGANVVVRNLGENPPPHVGLAFITGIYSNGHMKPFDFAEPYLRTVLEFLGITDVDVVRVEGVAHSAIGPEKALASATTQSKQLFAQLA